MKCVYYNPSKPIGNNKIVCNLKVKPEGIVHPRSEFRIFNNLGRIQVNNLEQKTQQRVLGIN